MPYEKKGGNGGARPGAGRKKKADKNATAISKAEKQIRDRLPEIVEMQKRLALGGIRQVEEKWIPSWYLLMKQRSDQSWEEPEDGKGKKKRKARTGADDLIDNSIQAAMEENEGVTDESDLVMVERKITHTLPDRAAGQYLIDRILGKPTQRNEIAGADGGPIEVHTTTTTYNYADALSDIAPPDAEARPVPDRPPPG